MSELRSAVRHIVSAPWLTAVIVASMALGTGANAAVYSAVDALLFRAPPGVVGAARLVDLYTSQLNGGTFGNSSYPDFLSIAATASLKAAAAVEEGDVETVRVGDANVTARAAAVSSGFLAAARHAGRAAEGAAAVSEDLWRSLGSDPGIVGRTAKIGAREYVIAAIAPRGFRGLHLDRVFDVWVPLDAPPQRGRGDRRLAVIGRLAANATIDRLQHELDLVAARPRGRTSGDEQGDAPQPRGNPPHHRRSLRPAGSRRPRPGDVVRHRAARRDGAAADQRMRECRALLLSRGMARRTELMIKTALGADRSRLVREAVLEGVLLALTGTVAGLLAATWTASSIPALFAPEHASLLDTHMQRPVIAATLGTGLLAGLVFALTPALVSTRGLSPAALRSDTAGLGERYGGARLRMLLVGAQLALSTIFLIASVPARPVLRHHAGCRSLACPRPARDSPQSRPTTRITEPPRCRACRRCLGCQRRLGRRASARQPGTPAVQDPTGRPDRARRRRRELRVGRLLPRHVHPGDRRPSVRPAGRAARRQRGHRQRGARPALSCRSRDRSVARRRQRPGPSRSSAPSRRAATEPLRARSGRWSIFRFRAPSPACSTPPFDFGRRHRPGSRRRCGAGGRRHREARRARLPGVPDARASPRTGSSEH